jgi:hypothetical protein
MTSMVPQVELDPDAVGEVADMAASRAEALRAVLTSAGPELGAVSGEWQTVAALRTCAAARLTDATAVADRIGAVATKLRDSVVEYVRMDDDLAARINAILPGE